MGEGDYRFLTIWNRGTFFELNFFFEWGAGTFLKLSLVGQRHFWPVEKPVNWFIIPWILHNVKRLFCAKILLRVCRVAYEKLCIVRGHSWRMSGRKKRRGLRGVRTSDIEKIYSLFFVIFAENHICMGKGGGYFWYSVSLKKRRRDTEIIENFCRRAYQSHAWGGALVITYN